MTDIQPTEIDFDGTDDAGLRAMIAKNVPHYPPIDEAKQRHEAVRYNVEEFARTMVELLPPSPERDQVVWLMTNDVMFYANAAIARNHAAIEAWQLDQSGPTADNPEDEVDYSRPENQVPQGTVRCRCPGGLCSHRS